MKHFITKCMIAASALALPAAATAGSYVKADVNPENLMTATKDSLSPRVLKSPAKAEAVDYGSLEWTELGTTEFFDCMFTGKRFNTTVEICTTNTNLLRFPDAWTKAGKGDPQPFVIDITDPRCVIVPKQFTGVPIGDNGDATIRSMSDWLISDYGFTVGEFLTTQPYYYFNISLEDGVLELDDWAILVAFPADPDNWGYASGEGSMDLPSEINYYYFGDGTLEYHINSITPACATVTGGTPEASLVIPESVEYDGTVYAVTEIGTNAFAGNTALTSVTIPSSVKKIGNEAFKGCTNIAELNLPADIEIAPDAFDGCATLTDAVVDGVTYRALSFNEPYCCEVVSKWNGDKLVPYTVETLEIPGEVTICGKAHKVTGIGYYAFGNATRLTSLTIPEGVTYIDDCAFIGASALTSLTIPASVETIGNGLAVFGNNTALKTIDVAEGSTRYSSTGGMLCDLAGTTLIACPDGSADSDGHVTLPSGINTLSSWSFYLTPSIKSLDLGTDVTTIGEYTFQQCGVENLVIPGSVKTIGSMAISVNDYLKTLTFEEGVVSVGSKNVTDCPYLETINIPSTLTDWALNFSGDSRLKRFNVADDNENFTDIDGVLFSADKKTLIRYPQSYATEYEIPEGTERLFDLSNSILTKVTIPASVNTIDPYCFAYPIRISGNTITQINMTEINSKIVEPFPIEYSTFYTSVSPGYTFKTYQLATLYVPVGTLNAYKKTRDWSSFDKIKEKEELGGVESTAAALNFKYAAGRLITDGSHVTVYTLDGKEIYSGCDGEIRLPRGVVYIIATPAATLKLLAK